MQGYMYKNIQLQTSANIHVHTELHKHIQKTYTTIQWNREAHKHIYVCTTILACIDTNTEISKYTNAEIDKCTIIQIYNSTTTNKHMYT